MYIYGGNCTDTVDGAILLKGQRDGDWDTVVTAKDTDVADLIIDNINAALDANFSFKISSSIRARYYASVIIV
ncbi:MAG: hypothetical protein ACJ73D_01455, partial [Pyrinomonadaceae bacterium]